jgi:hypothetical protein
MGGCGERLYDTIRHSFSFRQVRRAVEQGLIDPTRTVMIGARSRCRFAPPLIHSIPDSLTYSVPLFLKRKCDRTPGHDRHPRGPDVLGRFVPSV